MEGHQVVSAEEWLDARIELLAKEKELTRLRDTISAQRRALPWVRIEKEYLFGTPEGQVSLFELFEGHSQLIVKHYMMAPGKQTPASAALSKPTMSRALSSTCRTMTSPMQLWPGPRSRRSNHSPPNGLAVPVRIFLPQRLQLRLQRVVRARAGTRRDYLLQLSESPGSQGRPVGAQRLLQGRRWSDLPHLLCLRPRLGAPTTAWPTGCVHTTCTAKAGPSKATADITPPDRPAPNQHDGPTRPVPRCPIRFTLRRWATACRRRAPEDTVEASRHPRCDSHDA